MPNVSYTITQILQHPDLTVTSEERVLNAILMWCSKAKKLNGWEEVDELLKVSPPDVLFEDRLECLDGFLPSVRFALLPLTLLKKVCRLSVDCL